jgi:hypothetical protein
MIVKDTYHTTTMTTPHHHVRLASSSRRFLIQLSLTRGAQRRQDESPGRHQLWHASTAFIFKQKSCFELSEPTQDVTGVYGAEIPNGYRRFAVSGGVCVGKA